MSNKRAQAFLVVTILALAIAASRVFADPALPGGQGSVFSTSSDAFSLAIRNISREHHKDFVLGRSLFRQNWVAAPASVKGAQGLGPTFNSQSCVACHVNDGRSQVSGEFSGILMRISVPGRTVYGSPALVPGYGDQLNPHAIAGVKPEGNIKITYAEKIEKYSDGESVSLQKPTYELVDLQYGKMPEALMMSPRMAPPVMGLGFLEAIPERDILKNIGRYRDQGVIGKPNYVWSAAQKKKLLGRFGWKANQPSIAQQDASALVGDIGITSSVFPDQNCPESQPSCRVAIQGQQPEISAKDLAQLTRYMKTLAVPARRPLNGINPVQASALFDRVGCASCHQSQFKTGVDHEIPENSRQEIHPYTDLLLHDMGDGLADHRPDFEATGSEWRTPPLWGIGLTRFVSGTPRFLHDGRARSLEEAILWHGGEAENAKTNFKKLSAADRKLLIQFLESI